MNFVQARHYTHGPRSTVDLVVIHTAEVPQVTGAAESVARAFARTERLASAHYVVDDASVWQCVDERDIAWHAPGANRTGIGIELCGHASMDRGDWGAAYGAGMLEQAAALVADICRRWSIPLVVVDVAGLVAGVRGITGHAQVSMAFRKSTHTDPGVSFPWDAFLMMVTASTTPGPSLQYP